MRRCTPLPYTGRLTISFCVSVPVLSERRYWMRPSSSGMVEFLGMVPSIFLSRLMFQLYQIFPRSRLTQSEIGMIEQRRRTNRK